MRTQNKVQKNFKIGENQQVLRINHDELIVKNCPKRKQTIIQQSSFKLPPNYPSCKRNIWLELDKVWYCQICEHIINNQNIVLIKRISEKLRKDHVFSTRLPDAGKNLRGLYHPMVITTYKPAENLKIITKVKR